MTRYHLERVGTEWRLIGWTPAAHFRTFCAAVAWARRQKEKKDEAQQLEMDLAA
jgi:hypothetical protein